MANYKGIEIKDEIRPFLPLMPRVEEYREMLQSLQAVWDNLNLLGQLSGTTAEMGNTRAAFSSLTGDLLNNLAERTLAKRVLEMAGKSQVVIDILVRNLFERTADIGFLATDDELRRFVAAPNDPASLRDRLHEYVKKYSVYEDVVLISRAGEVLARLQDKVDVKHCQDAWVEEAISTSDPYVEYYGASDLLPNHPPALIYAYRIARQSGEILGVLGLCFRFQDEMERIFSGLSQADDPSLLALLNENNEVIASSDRWQLPLGAALNVTTGKMQRMRFAGRNYLAFASQTRGYQGYMGPGWRGLVLMPLDQAFEELLEDEESASLTPEVMASILSAGKAFPASLQSIPVKAQSIQRNLGRSVWNGTVRHSDATSTVNPGFSKILLSEISRTGMRMREVFSRSIGNLQTTVISALLSDSRFLAGLAIDIMDRNLYERANDCRWWALDPAIRRFTSQGGSEATTIGLEKVLSYINGLYTVYSNLIVFDVEGKVLSVSNPSASALIGSVLDGDWVKAALQLSGPQAYAVSAFDRTGLYEKRPTYIYAAAIRSPDDRQVVGGIGIVFDSEPQFFAMLSDVLPRAENGDTLEGAFACFVDTQGKIIASTDRRFEVGSQLPVGANLLHPGPGGGAEILELAGNLYAVGAQSSVGYREYKSKDDAYKNDVTALVFVNLGPFDKNAQLAREAVSVGTSMARSKKEGTCIEVATFYLGDYWLGLPVSSVVEAIELADAARLANAPKQVYGALIYRGETLPLYNLHAALGVPQKEGFEAAAQVVVLRGQEGRLFGILVDALGDVPEVATADIADVSSIYVGITPVLASVVKTPPGENLPMLTLLSVESMAIQLSGKTS